MRIVLAILTSLQLCASSQASTPQFLPSFSGPPALRRLIFSSVSHTWPTATTRREQYELVPGAELVFEEEFLTWIRDKRLGLITNQTAIDSQGTTTAERLLKDSRLRLVALFAPEHGLQGEAQAGKPIPSDPKVYSLYGQTRSPTPDMLENIDVLLYDIQDVGVRFYTFISTLFESMQAVASRDIPLIVLDRPNPIDGARVEGPVLEDGYESFVGVFPLPIRYGMTPGELAQMLNREGRIGCDLKIVPLRGWPRQSWYDQQDRLPWIMPSPNMPTLETATVYPGLCLIEATNLSEGRGTTRPFELIGAPWLKHRNLADHLNQLDLPGVWFRPQPFVPTFSKYQGEFCRGIQIHVLNRNQFRPIPVTIHLLAEVLKLHPQKTTFQEREFDLRVGNNWLRENLLRGEPVEKIVKKWRAALHKFKKKRKAYLLYR